MLNSSFSISSVRVQRLDIPLEQPILMSFGLVDKQNVVLVSVSDPQGCTGYGEAVALGGPYWGTESAEAIFAVVERYIAPALLRTSLNGLEDASRFLRSVIRGNAAAKSAVEMALLDLIGRRLNVPASLLLGGTCRNEIPVAWTLSTGSTETDIAEGERALRERGHTRFKVKLAKKNVEQDVVRVVHIIDAFRGRATVIADVNQGWDEVTALRYLPLLQEAGLEAIEQPLPISNTAAAARLRSTLHIEVIADEALTDTTAAFALAAAGGASAFALKPNRDGGILASRRLATIAGAAGIKLYGGTALETSLGTSAYAQLYASLPELELGSELFGPLRLKHDITEHRFIIRNGHLQPPTGPGLDVVPIPEMVNEFAMQRAEVTVQNT